MEQNILKKVLPSFELGASDSESKVLITEP